MPLGHAEGRGDPRPAVRCSQSRRSPAFAEDDILSTNVHRQSLWVIAKAYGYETSSWGLHQLNDAISKRRFTQHARRLQQGANLGDYLVHRRILCRQSHQCDAILNPALEICPGALLGFEDI